MNNIISKYPIILVHGIAARDSNLFWGRIPKKLRSMGLKVFPGNTDSWGSIENNAISLSKTVDYVLNLCQCDKVNIIAHSKGGLDSIFLISSLNYAEEIASLTTISTPHHGSEIVDYIFENKSIYNPISKRIINLIVKVYGDRSPEPYRIIAELTTKSMIEFNLRNLNSSLVYYSSYHTFMKNAFDDLSYFLTYQYIKKMAGDNDGIVSVKSALWGEDCTLIKGKNGDGISHSEIVDIKRKAISGVNIPDVYLNIVNKLSLKGF